MAAKSTKSKENRVGIGSTVSLTGLQSERMTVLRLLFLFALTLDAADWLNEGKVQPLEREISPATVAGLRLIWKRKLGEAPLSSPVIMGRLITYRGTVEL